MRQVNEVRAKHGKAPVDKLTNKVGPQQEGCISCDHGGKGAIVGAQRLAAGSSHARDCCWAAPCSPAIVSCGQGSLDPPNQNAQPSHHHSHRPTPQHSPLPSPPHAHPPQQPTIKPTHLTAHLPNRQVLKECLEGAVIDGAEFRPGAMTRDQLIQQCRRALALPADLAEGISTDIDRVTGVGRWGATGAAPRGGIDTNDSPA